jgi:hypothetical protein
MTPNRPILLLTQAAAEVSWLYASIAFVTLSLIGRNVPFAYGLAVFAFAALITHLSIGRWLRNVFILIIQIAAFAAATLMTVHGMDYPAFPLFSFDWIVQGFQGSHPQRYWLELILLGISALLYWIGGAFLSVRKMVYGSVCSRFDIGLAAFFALFLIQMVAEVKGGGRVDSNQGPYSLFSFLLFGLLSIGIARSTRVGSRSYLPGYGVFGILISFSAAVVLCVGSVILFFLPALQKAAVVGYSAIARGSGFLGSIILPILRFVLGPRGVRPDPPTPAADISRFQYLPPMTWYGRLIEDIMIWGSKGIMALMLLLAVGVIVFFIAKWLLGRSPQTTGPKRMGMRQNILSRLWLALRLLRRDMLLRMKGYKSAGDLYRALKTWGKRSGLALRPTETPLEFANRLGYFHPLLKGRIDLIVDAFNRETYGMGGIGEPELSHGRSSLRSLSHPRHWLRRLKTLLMKREDLY